MSVYISEPQITTTPAIGQLLVIYSKLVEDRRPEVINGRHIYCCLVAKFVGCTMN